MTDSGIFHWVLIIVIKATLITYNYSIIPMAYVNFTENIAKII